MAVTPQNYIASAASVTSVGPAERNELFSAKMRASRPAVTRTAKYFDVIYKIAV
jgi:hypothetical protein